MYMSTVINTNMASLYAQDNLSTAQTNLANAVQQLSSGLRINSAKDDAAGLAIAQNMQSQLNGTNQSIQNLNDATNLLQTADSSLSSIQNMLLNLKQLATEGYDGSLNGTQKLDIVQQMTDLNNEINATASRTTFNGINLLSSGSSIDLVNSGVQNGSALYESPTQISTTQGLGKVQYAGSPYTVSNVADGTSSGMSSFTTAITLDPTKLQSEPGSYTLTANGNQLTMSGLVGGQQTTQTLTVADVNNEDQNSSVTPTQDLNFSNFGVDMKLNLNVGAKNLLQGTSIASALAASTSPTASAVTGANVLTVNGQNATVQNINLQGTAPGTYTLSAGASLQGTISSGFATLAGSSGALTNATYTVQVQDVTSNNGGGGTAVVTIAGGTVSSAVLSGGGGYVNSDELSIAAGQLGAGSAGITFSLGASGNVNTTTVGAAGTLEMSGTVDGVATTQTVTLNSLAAQTSENINFNSFGISMNVVGNGTGTMTAGALAGQLTALQNTGQSAQGQLVVDQGNNSLLQFQSGPTSQSFININTINVQTGSSGANAGSAQQMMAVGTAITGTGSGDLGGLTAQSTAAQWQAAFQNAASSVDAAVDYISTQRSVYGSQMNRVSYISSNLTAQSTNLQNSQSAIMDTNFASETATLTKGQIMQQAATAMLAQANQMPNVILSLLK
jgi:flagellin